MIVISLILSCLVLASPKTRHGRNIISFYFFLLLTGLAKCIARALCAATHVTIAALFCSSSLLCISNSDWATENEAGLSVSVNGNEEPRWRDLSPTQFSCNCNYSLITHNKTPSSTLYLGGYWVCVLPARLPILTWVLSSVPSGSNIQDTFLIGSATDTTKSW